MVFYNVYNILKFSCVNKRIPSLDCSWKEMFVMQTSPLRDNGLTMFGDCAGSRPGPDLNSGYSTCNIIAPHLKSLCFVTHKTHV